MFTDTHAHIWWPSFAEATEGKDGLDAVLSRAKEKGVEKIIAPGTDLISSRKAIELARAYPGTVYAAVGIHPEETVSKTNAVTESTTMFHAQMKKMRQLIEENRQYVVAVGEIGTDANTQDLRETMKEQMNLMREQCEIAAEYNLPVIVHTRKSFAETLTVLDSMSTMPRGQFHCFSYDEHELAEVLRRGFYVSFCGNITWSKRVRRIMATAPSNRLLLETDSPLMMPRDSHGEPLMDSLRNEPVNVTILAQVQAEERGVSTSVLAEQTSQNVRELFGI